MALNKVKQLVSDTHELFFFELVSDTNRLRRLSGSWLVALTNRNYPEKPPKITPRFRCKIVKKSSDTIMEMAFFEQLPNCK